MRQILPLLGLLFTISFSCVSAVHATTYYISPNGNDNNDGLTENTAWATFDSAWTAINSGDTVLLMDGTYYQKLSSSHKTKSDITFKALNDGKAIIDGQGVSSPIYLAGDANVIIEGLVAVNGDTNTIEIRGNNNILRRVSAYNANTDKNSAIIWILGGDNIIEDCVAAGSGRKAILILTRESNNTVRRCFSHWREWDGREFCPIEYPYGSNIEIYDSSHQTIENSIGYGYAMAYQIGFKQQNGPPYEASHNRLMGNMAVYAGRKFDGSLHFDTWPTTRPGDCDVITDKSDHTIRAGFRIWGNGIMEGNVLKDNFAYGNAQLGLMNLAVGPQTNNQFVRGALVDNGIDNQAYYGGVPSDTTQVFLDKFDILQDNKIGIVKGGSPHTGGGARLTHRYIDGQLTNEYLWPWPMEDRIREEFAIHLKPEHQIENFSVTCEMGKLINQHTNYPITNIDVEDYCTDVPPPSPTQSPPTLPPTPGDQDGDHDVDFYDYLTLISNFSNHTILDFNFIVKYL